jgi:hypothetical protein
MLLNTAWGHKLLRPRNLKCIQHRRQLQDPALNGTISVPISEVCKTAMFVMLVRGSLKHTKMGSLTSTGMLVHTKFNKKWIFVL